MHLVHRPPRLAAAALSLGLACAASVTAAGCGSSAVSGALDPVARAATYSTSASGYRIVMSMSMNASALPAPITATGTGSFATARRLGSLDMTMNFGAIPAVAQSLGGSSLELREVLDGTTVYLRLPPALASKVPGAKPWLKLDLVQLAGRAGMSGISSLLTNPTSGNPAQMLQYLRASSGGVTQVGTQTVDGRRTTVYRATVDLDRYPNLVPASQRQAARQAIAQLKAMTKLSRFPIEAWIDGQRLVRQVRVAFSEQLPNTSQTLSLSMVIRIPQYGPQPAPPIPAADQVTDVSSLVPAQTSTGG